MPATRLRKDGQPDRRSHNDEDAAARRERLARMGVESGKARRANRIARLIEQAPPLNDDQRARLIVLLNGGHGGQVAS